MEANDVYVVPFDGRYVECHGLLEKTSNFIVVCADECDDDVWTDGRPYGGWFTTWEDVVECLQLHFASDILEITVV